MNRRPPLHAQLVVPVLIFASCVTTRTADPDRSPDPRPAKERVLVEQVVLPKPVPKHQGLRVVTQLSDRDPLVVVRVLFEAGSRDDPPGKEGLTALTAALMAEATEKLSSAQLRDALYPWAAEKSVHVDKDVTVFAGRVHSDHAAAYLDLFDDLILHPRLDPQDFERLRAEQISGIESSLRTSDDEQLQREALEALIYDAPNVLGAPATTQTTVRHPYRHTPKGTVGGLKAITLNDVKAHVATVFTRDGAILGVAGGGGQGAVDVLRASLESLPASTTMRPVLPPPVVPVANTLLVVDKPAAGTAISLGYAIDLDRGDADYAAMKLAETWFGEHRNMVGWLFNAMREQRGLNYGDYAYVEHFEQEGWSTFERTNIGRPQQYFSIWIRPVQHENRLFALRQAEFELARFVKRGIPDDESFERVQRFVQGYWRSKEQEATRRLGYAMDQTYYGQTWDRDALRAKVAQLTRADVNAAIKRHLRADRLFGVVVTEDGEAFRAEVLRRVPSPMNYASPKSPAIVAEDGAIMTYDLGLAPERVKVVKPDALFAR